MNQAKAPPPPPRPRQALEARVDTVRELRLFGWAVGRAPGRERIELLVGDVPVPAPVSRVDRPDVRAALSIDEDLPLGVEIDIPPAAWRLAGAHDALALRLRVDGVAVEPAVLVRPSEIIGLGVLARDLVATAPERAIALAARARSHAIEAGGAALAAVQALAPARAGRDAAGGGQAGADYALPDCMCGVLEQCDSLVVGGWVVGAPPGHEAITLWCGDRPVPCLVWRTPREDVRRATGAPHVQCGFALEIPPTVWSPPEPGAAMPEALDLHLEVDGFRFGRPWTLRRQDLPALRRRAASLPDDTDRQRTRWLLEEHEAAADGRLPPLPPAEVPDAMRLPGRLDRRWLDVAPLARAALALLEVLHRRAPSSPRAARWARALERRWTRDTGLLDLDVIEAQAAEAAPPVPEPGEDAPAAAGAAPGRADRLLDDYLRRGAARGWIPNLLFDPRGYVGQLPGRRPPVVNPLLHWALHGRFAGLRPCAWFDPAFHLARYPGVRGRRIDPLRDFLVRGAAVGRRPFDGYDPANAALHGAELRHARRQAEQRLPLLARLLAGLPPQTPLPRDRPLPWWPVLRLDGAPAPEPATVLAETATLPARGAGVMPRAPDRPDADRRVDVLVPVYAGLAETLSCIASVLAAGNRTPFELVVIDDTSPEPALSQALRDWAARGQLTLLANERNLGFVRTVNRGLALHPQRDVVILNSDTVVHGDWLDRLLAHAHGRADLASVTPLSGNATLCSYPAALSDNWAPLEMASQDLDALAARVNPGRSVPAPTGVGFCMLMTRDAITRVGLLDEEHFGRGYGEENDWCRRAAGLGLANVLASDVFVRHRGAVSFGAEADRRMASVLETLDQLHPGYVDTITAYLEDQPLAIERARLDAARLAARDPRPRVLLVSHARGGGTERHEREREGALAARGTGVLRARPGTAPTRLRLERGADDAPDLRLPNLDDVPATDPAALAELLSLLRVRQVEIHHLVDHPADRGDVLMRAAGIAGIPVEVTLHDYYAICPRINLVGEDGVYCGEPGPAGCTRCLRRGDPPMPGVRIAEWRAGAHALLARASRVRAPDEDVAERMHRYFPSLAITVEPHAADAPAHAAVRPVAARPAPSPACPAHLVVPGAIGAIKGFHVLEALAREARTAPWPLRLTVLGFTLDDDALRAQGVEVLGRYDDATLADRLVRLAPDAVLLPSVWPETYSYVLSAALAAGLPPVVFDLGAQARRLREPGIGLRLPLSLARSPEALARRLVAHVAALRAARGDGPAAADAPSVEVAREARGAGSGP